jgi:hypothetical protein
MRASDLLGRPVLDSGGKPLGHVIGLHAVQDGPVHGVLAAARLDSLLVSPRRVGSWLGYQSPEQNGPWIIAAIVGRLHRRDVVVTWSEVVGWEDEGPVRTSHR